jgi:integrase
MSIGQRKCKCPIWANGRVLGKLIRKSLKTRNWETAQRLVRDYERDGEQLALGISVSDACEKFLEYMRGRNFRPPTIWKYELLAKELKREFRGSLGAVSLGDLEAYQTSWKLAPISQVNKLSRLKKIFKYCFKRGWIRANPTIDMEPPVFIRKQVIPFTQDEMEKIVWATEVYPDNPPGRKVQVRAFVLVLRYTGLRIGDTVALKRSSITDGKLHLRTAKTGTDVWLPLKREVVEAIGEIKGSGDFYFWSGEGTLKSGISSWHRSMSTLFDLAGVEGHPHQFRHSFSVELLSCGVPIEDVAVLLGHSSSAITGKYYNAFVKSRQERLEVNIQKAWTL